MGKLHQGIQKGMKQGKLNVDKVIELTLEDKPNTEIAIKAGSLACHSFIHAADWA